MTLLTAKKNPLMFQTLHLGKFKKLFPILQRILSIRNTNMAVKQGRFEAVQKHGEIPLAVSIVTKSLSFSAKNPSHYLSRFKSALLDSHVCISYR